jgi:hypothetical protein
VPAPPGKNFGKGPVSDDAFHMTWCSELRDPRCRKGSATKAIAQVHSTTRHSKVYI